LSGAPSRLEWGAAGICFSRARFFNREERLQRKKRVFDEKRETSTKEERLQRKKRDFKNERKT